MTDYDLYTEETQNPTEHFWKRLKVGDTVLGREVVREAKDTACGWPQLIDLMSDEGTTWMVCRAGFDHPACGCPHEPSEDDDDEYNYGDVHEMDWTWNLDTKGGN